MPFRGTDIREGCKPAGVERRGIDFHRVERMLGSIYEFIILKCVRSGTE
jgi:hypothetical protein